MRALVVGAGAMGRWLGAVLNGSPDLAVDLWFADADREVAETAAEAFDAGVAPEPDSEDARLVCIAVPIPAAAAAIETWAPAAESAIVDVTGTAAEPLAAMEAHAPTLERASFHPLFAPANEPGTVASIVDAAGPTVEAVRDAIAARGNDLYETTAAEHDRAMATVQARTHAAVLAYGLAAEPVPEPLHTPISAALKDLVEQVTAGEPRVYADIQAAFDGADDVAGAAAELAAADREAFESLYAAARER